MYVNSSGITTELNSSGSAWTSELVVMFKYLPINIDNDGTHFTVNPSESWNVFCR